MLKKIMMKGLAIVTVMSSFSIGHAFSNGNITCTLDNGTVVNFSVMDCSISFSKWNPDGILPGGLRGASFSMTGRGILNACTNGRRELHLDYDRKIVYYGQSSSSANCEAW
ncbi:MAG: hypothetical protein ACXVB4_09480 [Pseudobdellovibrionaceae bacterium]